MPKSLAQNLDAVRAHIKRDGAGPGAPDALDRELALVRLDTAAMVAADMLEVLRGYARLPGVHGEPAREAIAKAEGK